MDLLLALCNAGPKTVEQSPMPQDVGSQVVPTDLILPGRNPGLRRRP